MDYETWAKIGDVAVLYRVKGGGHEVWRSGRRIGAGRSKAEAMQAAAWSLASDEDREAMRLRLVTARAVRT